MYYLSTLKYVLEDQIIIVQMVLNWTFADLQMKLEDGEASEDVEVAEDVKSKDSAREETAGAGTANQIDRKPLNLQQSGWPRRDGNLRAAKTVNFIFFYLLEEWWFGALSLKFFHIYFFSIARILKLQSQSMFRGYCRKMRIQGWLIGTKECWGSFWGL